MKIIETKVKIGALAKGFDISKYSGADEDVYCFDDKLNCRPAYQRNFVYNDKQKEEVIKTIFKGYATRQQFPLNSIYWAKMPDGTYQLLDGQQRILSILLFRCGKDTAMVGDKKEMYVGLGESYKEWFDDYELTIYICEAEGDEEQKRFEDELLDWFQVINIAGENLTTQELRNATHFGPWITAAKKDFANQKSKIFRDEYATDKYFKIDRKELNRQGFLETVLSWKSESEGKTIEEYMSEHRNDSNAEDLFNYFIEVLGWAETHFPIDDDEVIRGRDWGRLYNQYKNNFTMQTDEVISMVSQLCDDDEIQKKSGIVEYILSGEDERYLNFRQFEYQVKKETYRLQGGICPMCQEKQRQNPDKNIKVKYGFKEMEGDHIVPWSKGGKTVPENCCMLCKAHNGMKTDKDMIWLNAYMDHLRKKK